MPTRKQRAAQAAYYRSRRIRLREVGLISKRVSLKAKPTIYERTQLWKFRNVLARKATVVTVPKAIAAAYRKAGFAVRSAKGKRAVVVVSRRKGERVTFQKTTGYIIAKRGKTKRIYHVANLPPPARKSGKKYFYVLPYVNGQRIRFDEYGELQNWMMQSSASPAKGGNYKDWERYVEIEEDDIDADTGELEDE